jgi:hypothetical protein
MTAAQPLRVAPVATPTRPKRSKPATMTFPELFRLPATVDLATAATALGIHVNTAYKLVQRHAFPCTVMRLGWRHRVPTRALLHALHIDEIPIRLDDVGIGADVAASEGLPCTTETGPAWTS